MKEKKTLCPFKKAINIEYNPTTGRKEMHERFEECAGERCMAFQRKGFSDECRRLTKNA